MVLHECHEIVSMYLELRNIFLATRFMSKLFRDEVIRRHLSEVGVPLGLTPFCIRFYTVILLTCIVGGSLVIAFGSYSRKARV